MKKIYHIFFYILFKSAKNIRSDFDAAIAASIVISFIETLYISWAPDDAVGII